jgi:hypothetical protein
MRVDKGLLDSLTKRATGYQDRAKVFRLEQPAMASSVKSAIELTSLIWPWFDHCQMRPDAVSTASVASFLLPDDAGLQVFSASGAIAAAIRGIATRKPLEQDGRNADRKKLVALAEGTARIIADVYRAPDEELRFERLWQLKAQGATLKGERTPTALLQVTGAFRRYVHGLPVLGRASVHVTLGAHSAMTRWGVDWRRVSGKAVAETSVIEPAEGAHRVMADLFWRRPEKPFTLADFTPSSFMLGYVSMPRRQTQSILQPAWIAILDPAGGGTTRGQVVVVPAAPEAFEPLFLVERPVRVLKGRNPPGTT